MTSAGRKISFHTVENYVEALTESFILYKAERCDVKGKQYLTTGAKYYLADTGLQQHLIFAQSDSYRFLQQNIECLRRT